MSNSFQGVSSGAALLMNFYRKPMVSQFNDELRIMGATEKSKYPWSGSQVIRPLKVRRNAGIGATSDGGNLPNVGVQTTIQAQISAKYNYLRAGITGPMIKASQSDVASFVRDASYELTEGFKDLKSDVNRQLSWDGTGDLARVNTAAAASSSLVIKGREDNEPALKFVDVGLVFDLYNSSTLVQAGITVTAISGAPTDSTATLTLDQNVTASANHVLVRSGAGVSSEIQGLLTQLDNGTSTVFNITRASYVQTQGNVVDLASAQLTLNAMQQAQDAAEQRGGEAISAIWCDFSSRRMYQKLLTADKRYVNTVEGDGGFSKKGQNYLEFNGIPLVADKDCPVRMFFISEKHLEKVVLCEFEAADETGSNMIAASDNDQLEMRIRYFANLFNAKPAGCAVVQSYISP